MSASRAVRNFRIRPTVVAVGLMLGALPAWAQDAGTAAESRTLDEVHVLGTAEEQVKQSLGTSIITQQDLEERPPANDLSEIIRTMPGVNLTGAGSSGAYGNQRQIDIRGMGPENTLILIDGKPVLSRNGSLMRRSGERDTRGDTNWVPADAIERIEVIRGPAAARYGSGAAGGVVNIITKKATDKWTGSVTGYYSRPESSDEGGTRRADFLIAGPLSERLSLRLYGNVAKTKPDSVDLNTDEAGNFLASGREGTRNKDIDAVLNWELTPDQSLEFQTGFSRQGNIYSGETNTGVSYDPDLIGGETRRVYRQTASVTHRGNWGELGDSRLTFQYEKTRTANCYKGSAGASDGNCAAPGTGSELSAYPESKLENYYANGELHTPLKLLGRDQVLTTGLEFRQEKLADPNAIERATLNGVADAGSYGRMKEDSFALYLEDNIEVTRPFILTPGLRFDHYDDYGSNWSPSLNATYEITPEFTVKGGVARVFKAPNLYQTNPYYYYQSMGNGCPAGTGPCQIQGNPDLDPEKSVNKEIGLAWNNHRGWESSLTYFRNDYKNKITTVLDTDTLVPGTDYYTTQWMNSGKAVIHGMEGNFNVPLLGESGSRLKLINNFTWMFRSKSKDDGQPLSVIPKYTLNSTLDWRATEKFSTQLTATLYGRQKPRTLNGRSQPTTDSGLNEIGAYALFGINATYRFNKNYRVGFGVSNLLDKTIERKGNQSAGNNGGGAGAYTYNEPGRAYYVTFTGSF